MWVVRFYDGMLSASLKFLLGLNNTTLGFFIMGITFFFYVKQNHDGALFFGGVATTLLGLRSDKQNTNLINAPNATEVNNQPQKDSVQHA